MVPLLTLAAAAMGVIATAAPNHLEVTIDPATSAFAVSVGGTHWLTGLPPTAAWGSGSAGRPLTLTRHATTAGTHPTLGAYEETRFYWTEKGTTVETAFKIFADGQTALLEQLFPQGLPLGSQRNDTGMVADGLPLLAFPDFARPPREELGAVTWASTFSELATKPNNNGKYMAHSAVRLSELEYDSVSRANGGPVVAFDQADGYRSLVISPYDNFLDSTSYIAPALPGPVMACGIKGVPACGVKAATDVTGSTGSPKVDLASFSNLTRAECCSRCTANPKCEAWTRGSLPQKASPPGAVAHCWLVGGVTGTEASVGREVGCPVRNSTAAVPGAAPSWWSHGVSGAVHSLPAGFTHSTIITAAGLGITKRPAELGRHDVQGAQCDDSRPPPAGYRSEPPLILD